MPLEIVPFLILPLLQSLILKEDHLVLQLLVHRYNAEEWDNVIAKDPDWSREETDYLLDLCELFSLRFLVIADRYEVLTCQLCTAYSLHQAVKLFRSRAFGAQAQPILHAFLG